MEREELLKRLREQVERNAILWKENEQLVREHQSIKRRLHELLSRCKRASTHLASGQPRTEQCLGGWQF